MQLDQAAPLPLILALLLRMLLSWLLGLDLLQFLAREGNTGGPLRWGISCSTSAELCKYQSATLLLLFFFPVPFECYHSWCAICTEQTAGSFPHPMPSSGARSWRLAVTDVWKDKVNVTGSTKKIQPKPHSIWGNTVPAVCPLEEVISEAAATLALTLGKLSPIRDGE